MRAQGLHGGDVARVALELGCDQNLIIDFSANINPRGLPSSAIKSLLRAARDKGGRLSYPDWRSHPLRNTLAQRLEVPIESVVLGAGASALITDSIRTVRPSRCLAFTPAFAEYRRACDAIGAVFTGVPLSMCDQFKVNLPRCIELLRTQRPELLILNNPHNPSGSLMPASDIRIILDEAAETGTKILIDEAFIDYAPEDEVTAEASTRPGVIAIRSLTKFYGCPGLRIGYAVAHPSTARQIERQMPAWPIGSIALEALTAAVQDHEYARITIDENARQRASLANSLVELGFSKYSSAANFLLVRLPPNRLGSTYVREQLLLRHHILVRDCVSFEGLQDGHHIRIAVLTSDQNKLLIEALSELGSHGSNILATSGMKTEVFEPSHRGPILILLVGIPGSGKSTWAYRNAQSAIVVSQDDLIDSITPSGFDRSARPIYAAAEDAIARSALSAGRVVIIDRTNRTRSLRQRWLAIAREVRCPVVAIVMCADVETCRDRNRSRSGPRRVCEARMERMIAVFETPQPDEGFDVVLDDNAYPTVLDVIKALQRVRQA